LTITIKTKNQDVVQAAIEFAILCRFWFLVYIYGAGLSYHLRNTTKCVAKHILLLKKLPPQWCYFILWLNSSTRSY